MQEVPKHWGEGKTPRRVQSSSTGSRQWVVIWTRQGQEYEEHEESAAVRMHSGWWWRGLAVESNWTRWKSCLPHMIEEQKEPKTDDELKGQSEKNAVSGPTVLRSMRVWRMETWESWWWWGGRINIVDCGTIEDLLFDSCTETENQNQNQIQNQNHHCQRDDTGEKSREFEMRSRI